MNNPSENRPSSFPSISSLFRESWQVFTQSILNLFVLNILGIVIYLMLGGLAVVTFIISGFGSFLLQKGLSGLALMPPSMIITLIVVAAIFIIIFSIAATALQIASVLIVNASGKVSFGDSLRRSFGFVIPLFLTSILAFFLTFGAFFMFVLPAILFYFLLSFFWFEVILNNQTWTGALNRSVLIVSKNFGAILIRLIILILIYLAYGIFTSVISNISPETKVLVGIISFLINLLLGWFALAYQITLYKQAKSGIEQEKGKNILWMWIIAIIGWIIAAGVLFMAYKAISSEVLKNALKQSSATSPGISIQRSIDEMSPKAKLHYDRSTEIFKKMRQLQDSGRSDAEIVAETKRLNDENITELKKALALDPNNPKIWYELGNAYTWISSAGSLEDGLVAYKKAEELDSNNVFYINGVGDMLIKLGRYEEAVLHFQKTLRLTDKSGFANLSVAQAYANLKIYDSAREHYEKAIEIFTNENEDGAYDKYILQARKELSSLPK